jgi:purine-binding chemotaxis protein CheW
MTDDARKFIIFSMQGIQYALDLAQVAEVGDPPLLSPIPLSPLPFSGALNFHGDIVAVLNLPLFFGLTDCNHLGKIIILQQEVAALAFLVENIIKIVSEDEVSYVDVASDSFTTAKLVLIDSEAMLINLEALVREAEICMQNKP